MLLFTHNQLSKAMEVIITTADLNMMDGLTEEQLQSALGSGPFDHMTTGAYLSAALEVLLQRNERPCPSSTMFKMIRALVFWHVKHGTLRVHVTSEQLWELACALEGNQSFRRGVVRVHSPFMQRNMDLATIVVRYLRESAADFHEECFEHLLTVSLLGAHHAMTTELLQFAPIAKPLIVKCIVDVAFNNELTTKDIGRFEAVSPAVLGVDVDTLLKLSEVFLELHGHLATLRHDSIRSTGESEEFKTRTDALVESAGQAMTNGGLSETALRHVPIDFSMESVQERMDALHREAIKQAKLWSPLRATWISAVASASTTS